MDVFNRAYGIHTGDTSKCKFDIHTPHIHYKRNYVCTLTLILVCFHFNNDFLNTNSNFNSCSNHFFRASCHFVAHENFWESF